MRQRNVSLSSELQVVTSALDGMRLLTEQWKDLHMTDEWLPRLARSLEVV